MALGMAGAKPPVIPFWSLSEYSEGAMVNVESEVRVTIFF